MGKWTPQEEYFLCRTISHQWRPAGKLQRGKLDGAWVIMLKVSCANGCGTEREDFILVSNGELVARRYRHPDGYLMTGEGENRWSRQDFRMAFVKNALKTHDVIQVGGDVPYHRRPRRRKARRRIA